MKHIICETRLTIQLAKGRNTPMKNMAVVGPPQAAMKVMIIWASVPPTEDTMNVIPIDMAPKMTTDL